jgi:hypothetical protein
MVFLKIKSQIKSPFFNVILKISKSSQNDLKSDFVKSSIKSLNTLRSSHHQNVMKAMLLAKMFFYHPERAQSWALNRNLSSVG